MCANETERMHAIKRSKEECRGRRDRDRCLLEVRARHRLGKHPGVLRSEPAWQEEGNVCTCKRRCASSGR